MDNTHPNIDNYKRFTNYRKNKYINFKIEDFNMNYVIPPNPGGHITGVDILLNKRTAQINYRHNISLNMFNQFDIKYNYIDYIHLELVNEDKQYPDIFDIFNNGDYHVALAKKLIQFQY